MFIRLKVWGVGGTDSSILSVVKALTNIKLEQHGWVDMKKYWWLWCWYFRLTLPKLRQIWSVRQSRWCGWAPGRMRRWSHQRRNLHCNCISYIASTCRISVPNCRAWMWPARQWGRKECKRLQEEDTWMTVTSQQTDPLTTTSQRPTTPFSAQSQLLIVSCGRIPGSHLWLRWNVMAVDQFPRSDWPIAADRSAPVFSS